MGFGKDGKGQIIRENVTISLGTLAANTAIKASAQVAIQEDFRLIKTRASVNYFSPDLDVDNAIVVGIADNELSATEISEALTASPTDHNDNVPQERSMRPVFELQGVNGEYFFDSQANTPIAIAHVYDIDETIRWTFGNPEGWVWFAFNFTDAAFATGGLVNIHAKNYGVWVV